MLQQKRCKNCCCLNDLKKCVLFVRHFETNIGNRTFCANLSVVQALSSGLENSHINKHANPVILGELALSGGMGILI